MRNPFTGLVLNYIQPLRKRRSRNQWLDHDAYSSRYLNLQAYLLI